VAKAFLDHGDKLKNERSTAGFRIIYARAYLQKLISMLPEKADSMHTAREAIQQER
jgi:hypothetical protein